MVSLGIVRYDAMCAAIAECYGIDEAKDIRDKARAIEVYAQQAQNFEAERKACEIRIRAERRAGELLIEMKEAGQRGDGHAPLKGRGKVESSSVTPPKTSAPMPDPPKHTLKDLGITRNQSSKWQKLANVPEEEFEKAVSGDGPKPTTVGIINGTCIKPGPHAEGPDFTKRQRLLNNAAQNRMVDALSVIRGACRNLVNLNVPNLRHHCTPEELRDWSRIAFSSARTLRSLALALKGKE